MVAEIPLSIVIGILLAVALASQGLILVLDRRRKRVGENAASESRQTGQQADK
jgi:hypothetical protein